MAASISVLLFIVLAALAQPIYDMATQRQSLPASIQEHGANRYRSVFQPIVMMCLAVGGLLVEKEVVSQYRVDFFLLVLLVIGSIVFSVMDQANGVREWEENIPTYITIVLGLALLGITVYSSPGPGLEPADDQYQ